MNFGRAQKALKNARKDAKLTQQQMSMDDELFLSRESVSHQECGRHKVQPEVAQYFTEKHNDPRAAIEAASEYAGWGPLILDGETADLHRVNLLVQSKIQMTEALESLQNSVDHISVNPKTLSDTRKIEKSIQECLDVITALTQLIVVLCKEYSISWMKMWGKHKMKLLTRGLIKGVS
ncbi:XRE family transcriptional regulator [Bacillus swezeyi]|uniref:XRE family transcriptional regulator n=1 Tax=Bacillus swezeyi TaxID=1925020 RepID=UPI002E21AA73|nr:XRE family transcriptional regulator [Bacillus swezeyi]